jgi:hypothetical protein
LTTASQEALLLVHVDHRMFPTAYSPFSLASLPPSQWPTLALLHALLLKAFLWTK